MDPVIKQLNQVAQGRVGMSGGPSPISVEKPAIGGKSFDETFTNQLLDKIREDFGNGPSSEMNVISADDIHIETQNAEMSLQSETQSEKFFGLLKNLNKDMGALDATLETLSTPGMKFTPIQALTLQAGIANTTIFAEGFTRVVDGLSRGIQTIIQMPVGGG